MKKISFLQDVEIVHSIVFKHCILYCVTVELTYTCQKQLHAWTKVLSLKFERVRSIKKTHTHRKFVLRCQNQLTDYFFDICRSSNL